MKRFILITFSLILLVSSGVGTVKAQDKGIIDLRMVAEVEVKVINEDGEPEVKRVPAEKVIPGDVVIYTIYYSNTGVKQAEEVVIINPIPEHMIYTVNSAHGKGTIITYSVDNGKTYANHEELKILDDTGLNHPAKASDYTHIRWAIAEPLEAGASGFVGFKAKLE